jgi:hypothetical protein
LPFLWILNVSEIGVIKIFEDSLQNVFIITSSFKEITDGNFNSRRNFWQLFFLILEIFYVCPRYGLFCLLYFTKKETRLKYQYLCGDYFEELGLFGKTLNFVYCFWSVTYCADVILLRKRERNNSIQFMTDLHHLSINTDWGSLNSEERLKLLKTISKKIIFVQLSRKVTIFSTQLYDLMAVILFFIRKQPSIFVASHVIAHFILVLKLIELVHSHFFFLYLSYVLVTDCFIARINSLQRKMQEFREDFCKEKLRDRIQQQEDIVSEKDELETILNETDTLRGDLQSYNRTLSPLLRNMVYLFRGGLCVTFFMATIDVNVWVRLLMMCFVIGVTISFVFTALYVSQINSAITSVYHGLDFLYGKTISQDRGKTPLKARSLLRRTIKEFGSQEKDGHFVIGLSDGSGPAISKAEMMNLTLDTIGNTLMFIKIIYLKASTTRNIDL